MGDRAQGGNTETVLVRCVEVLFSNQQRKPWHQSLAPAETSILAIASRPVAFAQWSGV